MKEKELDERYEKFQEDIKALLFYIYSSDVTNGITDRNFFLTLMDIIDNYELMNREARK
jgi:hypothetical protein